MSSVPAETIADVRRAIWYLLGLAGLCVVLAAIYRNPYVFDDPLGRLPDISVPAGVLMRCFQISAVVSVTWVFVLGMLASPQRALRARALWCGWALTERVRPRAVVLAVGLAVTYAAIRWWANKETLFGTLEMFTDGTARTPFQYRALVPWLVRAVTEILPSLPLVGMYGIVEAVAAFGLYAAFVLLLQSFVADRPTRRLAALAVFIPLALNLATPYRYNAIYFPYDTPSVAFFTLGLALILRRDWRLFYPLFVVATLNRETTCFLTVAYLLVAIGRERPSQIAAHVVVQAALWMGIKVGLSMLYVENLPLDSGVGGLFANQLIRSGRILMAVPGLVYMLLVTMGGAGAVVLLLWRRVRDERLRRLFGIVPLFFAGMVVVGELLEVRIYSELIPLVTLALLLIIRDITAEAVGGTSMRTGAGTPPRRAFRTDFLPAEADRVSQRA